MCLIQGSIWTLKWGVIAHITVALGQFIQLFRSRITLLALAAGSTLFYIIALQVHLTVRPLPSDILLASQLAWPFLTGMTVFAFWEKISSNPLTNVIIAAAFIAVASVMYFVDFIPWTKAIIVSLTMGWAWLGVTCLKLPSDKFAFLNNWPALALAIYLINWPVSQMTLLLMPDLTAGTLMTLSLPLTIALSYFAHKLVSKRSYLFARERVLTT